MKRHKGQFASSKINSEEVVTASSSGVFVQNNFQEETSQHALYVPFSMTILFILHYDFTFQCCLVKQPEDSK